MGNECCVEGDGVDCTGRDAAALKEIDQVRAVATGISPPSLCLRSANRPHVAARLLDVRADGPLSRAGLEGGGRSGVRDVKHSLRGREARCLARRTSISSGDWRRWRSYFCAGRSVDARGWDGMGVVCGCICFRHCACGRLSCLVSQQSIVLCYYGGTMALVRDARTPS